MWLRFEASAWSVTLSRRQAPACTAVPRDVRQMHELTRVGAQCEDREWRGSVLLRPCEAWPRVEAGSELTRVLVSLGPHGNKTSDKHQASHRGGKMKQ